MNSFYVPMFVMALWNLYAMVKSLQWASLPESEFKKADTDRQIVLFNSFVSILFAVGVVTYAKGTVNIKMPKFAVGSLITWQLVSNLIVASYAWKGMPAKPVNYNDWRRGFTRIAALFNLVSVLMVVFGVNIVNMDKIKKLTA